MKPDADIYLAELQRSLLADIAPRLTSAFEQGALNRHAMLLQGVIEDFDRAAAWRIEENGALRRLFADATSVVPASELASALAAAAGENEPSYRVRDLDRANGRLRGVLVRLHACVEQLGGQSARDLEQAIWRELARSVERRRTSIGRF